MNKKDIDIDELLSGGYLSGPQYDDIASRVLEQETRKPRPRKWWPMLSAAAVLVGGLVLVFSEMRTHDEGITAKGGSNNGALAASVELGCDGNVSVARKLRCPLGSTLLFSVNTSEVRGFIGAFAKRLGSSGEDRIWYFPGPGKSSVPLPKVQGTSVLEQGVRLGEPHKPGQYQVTVLVSPKPRTREQLTHASADLRTLTFDLELTP